MVFQSGHLCKYYLSPPEYYVVYELRPSPCLSTSPYNFCNNNKPSGTDTGKTTKKSETQAWNFDENVDYHN
jgi:hypothetical protein